MPGEVTYQGSKTWWPAHRIPSPTCVCVCVRAAAGAVYHRRARRMPPLMEVVRSLARRYHCPCSSLLQSTSGGGSRRWTPPMSAQASVAFPLAELPRRLDLRSRRRVQPRHQSFTLDLRLHHHHHHHHQQQQQQQQWIMKCFSTTATEEGKEAKCLPGKAAPGSGELSGDGVSVNRGDMPTGEAFLQEFLEYSRQKFIENRFLTSPYLQQKREILSFYRLAPPPSPSLPSLHSPPHVTSLADLLSPPSAPHLPACAGWRLH